MATEASARAFFASSNFAVVGASSDPAKYGHKVFSYYLAHSLPVTPINPSSPTVTVSSESYPTVASPRALPSPRETSLSIITPPAVTKKVLQEAQEAGIRAVWLQPGSFDEETLAMALRTWKGTAVGGAGGAGDEGWCILVDGETAMQSAGKL